MNVPATREGHPRQPKELLIVPSASYMGWPAYMEHPYNGRLSFFIG
ncbi:hypothetical protein IIA16_02020 [bacterium]|nr:hypothetical protein [bacterium]